MSVQPVPTGLVTGEETPETAATMTATAQASGIGSATGKPDLTGTMRALEAQTEKPGGPAEGLVAAADKQAGKADHGEGSSAPDAFAKLVEGEPKGEAGAKLDGAAKPALASFEPKTEAMASTPAGPLVAAGTGPREAPGAQATPGQAQPQGPVLNQVPLSAVPIEIGLKSLAGVNQFEIRLDPVELGRIDVSLEIGESGEVKAHLVVERVETLNLLQRDAKTLERAFEQAGLKPSEGGIDLTLRDSSAEGRQQGRERDEGGQGRRGDRLGESERIDATPQKPQRTQWRGLTGVDVRI